MFLLLLYSSLFFLVLSSHPFITAFILTLSLLFFFPLGSFFLVKWYLYLFSLLFLSGVFVMLLYITNMGVQKKSVFLFSFFFMFMVGAPFMSMNASMFFGSSLYFTPFFVLPLILIFSYYFCFVSYFLNKGVFLRSL